MTSLVGSLTAVQSTPLPRSGRASSQSSGRSCGHWLLTAGPICWEKQEANKTSVFRRKEHPSVCWLPRPSHSGQATSTALAGGGGPLTGHLPSHLHRRSSPTMAGALPSARAPLHLGPNSRI